MNTKEANDLRAAMDWVESMVPHADGNSSTASPWWYGWALREAYLAGLKAGRKGQKEMPTAGQLEGNGA